MLAKVFLSSILAAVFAVCVIAAPADDPPPPDVNVVFESAPASVVAALATTTASGPPPTESTITPNQDDEITTSDASGDSDGVFGRDLESLGRVGPGPQPPPGCVTVYSDPNFSWWWRFHISSIRPSPRIITLSKNSSDEPH
ncbi:hypothetical protein B9Z19DRAFT_1063806 [Tuber borchii]|uniref:Secreted protein n=1 Tax=Tuber borchii TaxID=42251 RepID=A0A2T6ZX17_TUBBO|nr:hypothetical protein B9Z19DRAFT_1063806 [Tuber borchii]